MIMTFFQKYYCSFLIIQGILGFDCKNLSLHTNIAEKELTNKLKQHLNMFEKFEHTPEERMKRNLIVYDDSWQRVSLKIKC